MTTDWRAQAQEALLLVSVDPTRAVEVASAVSRSARRHDDGAASMAERAWGLAAAQLQDLEVARAHLRLAVRLAGASCEDVLAAEARMSLAGTLYRLGQSAAALKEVDAAVAGLTGASAARALTQRAIILWHLGRTEEAMGGFRTALRTLRQEGDLLWVQRTLSNRAVVHAFSNAFGPALRDLQEAQALCEQLGLRLPAAIVLENLAVVHRRLGDVPTALHYMDAADERYRSLGAPIGSVLSERSELLLSVRLLVEAREAAGRAVSEFERTHERVGTPEARLLLARTATLTGDHELALRESRRAVRELQRQGRVEWTALARMAVLFARLESDDAESVRLGELSRAADDVELAGWVDTALDARLAGGRRGLASGSRAAAERARRELGRVSRVRRAGPAARRAKAWYATALLRADDGDATGAANAALRGLRILGDYRATVAATDLRARMAGLGADLAALGLRQALASGSAYQVLGWAEQGRARHLLERPATPPDDPELTQHLAELRSVMSQIGDRQRDGRPPGPLVARQVQLERAIRDATRRALVGRPAAAAGLGLPPRAELAACLGDAALAELVESDGQLAAVTLVDGRLRLHDLGPAAAVADRVRWLPFGLRRLARSQSGGASRDAAAAMLRDVGAGLDATLLAPLARDIRDRPLVLVPTGALQSLPWSLLPSLAGRPVTVAPSAGTWHLAASRQPVPGPVVVIAGPGLPGAQQEAQAVAALYAVRPLLREHAAVGAVSSALDGAGLAHLAAHGSVRADNPLFSSLRLADGPLTVYDLERVGHGTDTVVLAACESGRSVVWAGDELLGLAAAFLSHDTRHLVASVVPVPDAETAPLMVAFHELLAQGVPVADALAQAQLRGDAEDPRAFAAAAGFVCLGAGFGTPAITPAPRDQPRDRQASAEDDLGVDASAR